MNFCEIEVFVVGKQRLSRVQYVTKTNPPVRF